MASRNHLMLLFQIFCLCFLGFARQQDDNCDPEKSCEKAEAGTFVKDPTDCQSYYVCIETKENNDTVPSDNPLKCPTGQHFDETEKKCTKERDQQCANSCANRGCPTKCSGSSYHQVVYPGDCNKYYLCVPGEDEPIVALCPDDSPYFDGDACVDDKYTCCADCTPYCEYANTETADPVNCTKYYLCIEDETTPSEDYHFSCAENMYFNIKHGHCEKKTETPCSPLCPYSNQ